MINAGAVAAEGMPETKPAKGKLSKKQRDTTKLVRPVLPPAPIPAADSRYVVVGEVPSIAPIGVAIASANNDYPS